MHTPRFAVALALLRAAAVTRAGPANLPLLGEAGLHFYTIPAFEVFKRSLGGLSHQLQ
ncbi:MAG: hypothetical protein AAGA68_16140 [Pseudomonadota bacterium]